MALSYIWQFTTISTLKVDLHAGDLLLVLCLTMASSVLSASFAVFLVRERECHSKGVQMVAGASPSAFWSAAYVWDLLNFSIPTLGISMTSLLIHRCKSALLPLNRLHRLGRPFWWCHKLADYAHRCSLQLR